MGKETTSTDHPEEHSAFGRAGLIEKLADQIDNHLSDDSPSIEPSLVVGVLGEWGSGKSTILQALNDLYNQRLKSESDGSITLPVFFNPWRFEAEVHLIVPLLKTAQSCVKKYLKTQTDSDDKSFKSSVVRLGQTAVALASAFKGKVSIPGIAELEVNVKDAFDKEKEYLDDDDRSAYTVDFDSIYFDLHEQMEQITGRSDSAAAKLNLLFLIDDLDRCLPEKAVQVMESVKLFLDARGCAFVLALDEEVVERGIVHRYRDYLFQGGNGSNKADMSTENLLNQLPITGAEYLEKIIQLPIHLPRPDDAGIRRFLMTRFPVLFKDYEYEPKEQEKTKQRSDAPLLNLFIHAIPPIPRKHVRAATLLEFLLSLAKEQGLSIDQMTLARLVMLQLFAPELYRHGKRNPGFLLTMERWAKENGTAWTSKALVSRLLEKTNTELNDQARSVKDEVSDEPVNRSESIITLEGDQAILQYISLCTQNRGEFDPRNIIDTDQRSDKEIARYFTFIEKQTIVKVRPATLTLNSHSATVTVQPEVNIGDVDAFIEQLLSDREDAWVNAIQSEEIELGEVLPQSVFEKILKRLYELPGDDWLAQVVPVLTDAQREYIKEKFSDKFQEANEVVLNPKLGDVENNARSGRIVGWLGDERHGVGLDEDGLPDIDWVEVEAPNIAYRLDTEKDEIIVDRKGELVLDYPYKMARFPVTWLQFQSFIEHPNGYENDEWWQSLDVDEDDRKIEAARWPIPNHPRDTINWFQCLAFCRWLNNVNKLGDDQLISLPTEWEWQYVASNGDIKKFLYPWGENYQPGYANINETLGEVGSSNLKLTTAVGVYPQSETGLADLPGNIWEWCLNQVEDKKNDNISIAGMAARALRGGSWYNFSEYASSACRFRYLPNYRNHYWGFRVVCVPSYRRTTDH